MEDSRTSKAVVIEKFGGYESLSVRTFDLPDLENNIEVKVEYGGVNFADIYTRQGLIKDKKLPFVLGMECSGTITAIGSNVGETEFQVGQRVICYDFNGGLHREVVRVSPKNCFLLPEYISTKLGATIFVTHLTAYFSILCLGNLKENSSVLILSCAGGVGSAATQLAKIMKGVVVYGTGSANKEEAARKNGVDVFIPNEQFEKLKEYKFDLILTNQAGDTLSSLQELLNPLGNIVIIGANNMIENEKKISLFALFKSWWTNRDVSVSSLIVNSRAVAGLHLGLLLESNRNKVKEALDHVYALIEQGNLKPLIHSILPMAEIETATRLLVERKNVGKVLIEM